MTDKEQTTFLIDRYMNLLRVIKAGDAAWKNEVDNQLCQTKAQLEALGVVTEQLVIK